MAMQKTKVKAVFNEDLEKILIKLGLKEKIDSGDFYCLSCNRIITKDNIQLIIPRREDQMDFICNTPTCIEDFHTAQRSNNEQIG